MKAVIMAGGKGSRLYPFSAILPKPLMPLGKMPVLELLLRQLAAAGIDHAILAVNHMHRLIEAFFGDGSRFGLSIEYSTEERPLGTAGPIGVVLDRLGEDFVLANADLLTSLDISGMITAHRATGADATIGVFERKVKSEFGLIDVDEHMRMVGYREKPLETRLVSMGFYILRASSVRPFVRPNAHLDMPQLMLAMMQAGYSLQCHQQECIWLDIGRPEDFAAAQRLFEQEPEQFLPSAWVRMSRRALVTGANGFLGRHLSARLRSEAWTVICAVREAPVPLPSDTLSLGPGRWNDAALAGALEASRPDVVFHLAGSAWAEPVSAQYETNVILAARLLDAAAARSPAPAVVLIGSAAEYGYVPEDCQPVTEDFPCAPLTHHGIAKNAQTRLGLAWARSGLPVLIARLFNPVGIGMPPRLALADFAAQIRAGQPSLEVGDLDVARDLIHVEEAARLIAALAADRRNFGQVVNICSGVAFRLRPLVEELVRLADRPVDLVTNPARFRPGEMRSLRGDTARLRDAGLVVQTPDLMRLLLQLLGRTSPGGFA